MSSRRLRRAAARANGKKSTGPVTPQPAGNANRPVLFASARLAASICLSNENRADFIQLHENLLGEFAPATPFEHLLVEEMVVARWRQQRAWLIETYLMEDQMDRMTGAVEKEYVSIHEATRITLAFRDLAEKPPALQMLQRYESRLSRQVERCRKQLKSLRTSPAASPAPSPRETLELQNVPNDPNPKNEPLSRLLNILNQPRQPLSQFRLQAAPGQSQLLPLNRHPNWRNFIMDLNITILKQAPHLKDSFHELLRRADQLE